jgi:hypothetical protein
MKMKQKKYFLAIFSMIVRFFAEISPSVRQYDLRPKKYVFPHPQFFLMDENDPLNRFIRSFCLKIAPEGEKRLLFMNFE